MGSVHYILDYSAACTRAVNLVPSPAACSTRASWVILYQNTDGPWEYATSCKIDRLSNVSDQLYFYVNSNVSDQLYFYVNSNVSDQLYFYVNSTVTV